MFLQYKHIKMTTVHLYWWTSSKIEKEYLNSINITWNLMDNEEAAVKLVDDLIT